MSKTIRLKKGKDIGLVGQAPLALKGDIASATYALKPTDFRFLVPKMEVKVGDEVQCGDALFHDKSNDRVKFTSPVSGEVVEILRGERRAIQAVKVLADKEVKRKKFKVSDSSSKEEIIDVLLESGLWPNIVERPFGVIANPEESPKAIHISCFDSAPLAPDFSFILDGEQEAFHKGVEILKKLTDGKVHLNLRKGGKNNVFEGNSNAEYTYFSGPHPSGLVGVQIHHIDPINKGDIVWTLNPIHAAQIGKLFLTGELHRETKIALAGSDVKEPGYYQCIQGLDLTDTKTSHVADGARVISGNVLTGTQLADINYLGYFDQLVTAIPEGDDYEFMGWLFPSYARPTLSNSLPISKFLKKTFKVNTNYHGEERAYVVTGQYEKVTPMDIMPQQLVKSILAGDFEKMENLGIYEVIEEDLALCEFVCTSKIEVQQILSDGIELMSEE
jgi:Na+-transporting NADH:ubiquinone oxidoreductase subunit A